MAYYKFSTQSGKLPLRTWLFLIFGLVAGLTLLSLFAFTFFIISLVTGMVLFLVNLFQRRGRKITGSPVQYYRPIKRDDDIIDV